MLTRRDSQTPIIWCDQRTAEEVEQMKKVVGKRLIETQRILP